MSKRTSGTRSLAPDKSDMAMLVLDLLSDYRFPDGPKVYRAALPVARRIAALKRRARKAGVPVIYVNDNLGRWRSDLAEIVHHCSTSSAYGAAMVKLLGPAKDDYCILKPRHSGFFATALDTLLEYIGASRLVITGVSSNQCVLFTANDAYVRDYALRIPRDCIAAPSSRETRFALQYFRSVLGADLRPSTSIRFRATQSPVS
jgi:nicotinamidase-related amidase